MVQAEKHVVSYDSVTEACKYIKALQQTDQTMAVQPQGVPPPYSSRYRCQGTLSRLHQCWNSLKTSQSVLASYSQRVKFQAAAEKLKQLRQLEMYRGLRASCGDVPCCFLASCRLAIC